jgi:hypothetical protein
VEISREAIRIVLVEEILNNEVSFKTLIDVLSKSASVKFEKKGNELSLKFKGSSSAKQNMLKFLDILEELSGNFSYYEGNFTTYP